jgi:hypothetical protein
METTADKVERFARFLKIHHRESDAVIDPVLDKLLDRERQSLLKQRDELCAELDYFERQYALKSSEFYEKFQRGEMGDDVDFVEWYGAWRMYQNTLESLKTLDSEFIPS